MATATVEEIAAGLREWARGCYPLMAAVELLVNAHGGRLLSGVWVEYDPDCDRYWFNAERVAGEIGYLSGGERRLMLLAASLADPDALVSLNDALPGLDRDALAHFVAAAAHAAGFEVIADWGAAS